MKDLRMLFACVIPVTLFQYVNRILFICINLLMVVGTRLINWHYE